MADYSITSSEFPAVAIGRERLKSDRRQLGGLMLLLGTCATFQPLTGVASLVGTGDDTGEENTPIQKAALASGLIQIVFGTLAMVVGYLSLIHDYGNKIISGVLIILTQFAWMPLITGMTEVGKAASSPYTIEVRRSIVGGTIILEEYVGNPFIPEDYLPTHRDVRFFGAMGLCGILSYGTAFLGSLAFTEFALHTFDSGKPTTRDARFYRGRLLFYTFVLIIAGMSQLLLAGYVLFEFGNAPLVPSVGVAMYQVHFPQISITIGILQMLVGYYGVARYLSWVPVGPHDHEYQIMLLVQWVAMLILQYLVQISYGSGNENAGDVPSLALLSVGLNVLPAFLDYKMRTTPRYLTDEYYGIMVKGQNDNTYHEPVPPAIERLESGDSFEFDKVDDDHDTMGQGQLVQFTTISSNQGSEKEEPDTMETETSSVELLVAADIESQRGLSDQLQSTSPDDDDNDVVDDVNDVNDDTVEAKPEPSARLNSRKVDPNEETNMLYKKMEESQQQPRMDMHEEELYQKFLDTQLEPSERVEPRRIDRNQEINEMYEQQNQSQRTEPSSNKSNGVSREEELKHNDYFRPLNDIPDRVETDGPSVTSVDQMSEDMSRHNRNEDTNRDGSEAASRDLSADMNQDSRSESMSQDHSEDPSLDLSRDRSEDVSRDASRESTERGIDDLSRDRSDEASQDVSRDTSRDASRDLSRESTERDTPRSQDPPEYAYSFNNPSDHDRSVPESTLTSVSSESGSRHLDPPESTRTMLSIDSVDPDATNISPIECEEASGNYFTGYDSSSEPDMSEDTPDDSTAVLEQKLDDIEKELYDLDKLEKRISTGTDPIASLENLLADLL